MRDSSNNSAIRIYAAVAGIVLLLGINAFAVVYFSDPFDRGAQIDTDNLASYIVSKTNLMYDDIPVESGTQSDDGSQSGELQYPTDLPYFIEVDKTNQVVTVFTTSSTGKYDKPVRVMLCSTAQNPKKFPNGYWYLKENRDSAQKVWRTMKSHGAPLYAQYATQITGDFLFHSVPYTDKKKDALDLKRFANLGTADSGGCIRLTVENAKWINENCKAGTWVHITENKKNPSLTQALKEQVPKPDASGWDPTDPDPKNPNYHPQYTEDTPEPEGYLVDNRGLKELKKKKSKEIWNPNQYVS